MGFVFGWRHRVRMQRAPIWMMLLMAPFCSVAAGMIGSQTYREIRDGLASLEFQRVTGEVTGTTVERVGRDRRPGYATTIHYQFSNQGQSYIGSHSTAGESATKSIEWAELVQADHPPGKPVQVYFDPTNPMRSTLYHGVPPLVWIGVLATQVFVVMALGLWGYLAHLITAKVHARSPNRSLVDALVAGQTIALRSSVRWAAALVAAGALPIVALFAGSFVFAVLFPSAVGALPVFCTLVSAASLLFAAVLLFRFNDGQSWRAHRLTFDADGKRFLLQSGSRNAPRSITLSDIRHVTLKEVGGQRSWRQLRFVPTLVLPKIDRTPQHVELVQWASESDAKDLVQALKRCVNAARSARATTDARRWAST